jgi:hypothetical protein
MEFGIVKPGILNRRFQSLPTYIIVVKHGIILEL